MPNEETTPQEGVRINKYISSSGFCSRREADTYVERGVVTVDNVIAVNGTKVMDGQVVRIEGKPILPDEDYCYIALHKPVGITCTTDRRDKDNVIDYLQYGKRIFPIGRLDKNSSGLLLLTNNGDIVNKLLRAEGGHDKEYVVEVDHQIDDGFVKKMTSGIPLRELDAVTLPCEVTITGKCTFRIVLHQGLNRQIRRMCEYMGYRVIRLKRVRILNITLGSLPVGEMRNLTAKEVHDLLRLIS
ncbi:MAG TPA: pseudouridine synthase [Bacillota bacterium]|nr:pseudouridine synthase [Bacillota bacterium]HPE38976.1 pseudouridine synthase [Bacillota bacterium]